MKKAIFWLLSLVVTLSFAVYQRKTGPTYPVKGGKVEGTRIYHYRFLRSCTSGTTDCLINLNSLEPAAGRVEWRRYKSGEPFASVPLEFKNERLFYYLPSQPPAGKLEYRVFVQTDKGERELTEKPLVTRFKGHVPHWILTPHIILMFLFMLLSARLFLTAAFGAPPVAHGVPVTVGCLLLGGFVFGPATQYYAFGQAWTGFPFGYDLTDNKTLLMLLAWLPALWAALKKKPDRAWVLAAFLVTAAVYLVPHSLFGSELNYASGQVGTGR